jgi:hypothetical protein
MDDKDGGGPRGWCLLFLPLPDGCRIFLVNATTYGDSVAPDNGWDRAANCMVCIGSTLKACIHLGGFGAVVVGAVGAGVGVGTVVEGAVVAGTVVGGAVVEGVAVSIVSVAGRSGVGVGSTTTGATGINDGGWGTGTGPKATNLVE